MTATPWLAQRVGTPAPVPAGCVGLLQSAGATQLFAPGELVQPRVEEALWWVSTRGALRIVFAPSPLAPEAGLSLYVGPVLREGRLLFSQALGDWSCVLCLACTCRAKPAIRYRSGSIT